MSVESYGLNSGNTAPRSPASTIVGDKVFKYTTAGCAGQ